MERLTSRRGFHRLALSAAATVALPRLASAQAFPARPIKLICPWPAGGATDAVMRAIAESAGKALGGRLWWRTRPVLAACSAPTSLLKGAAGRPAHVCRQLTIGIAWSHRICRRCKFDPAQALY